MKIVSIVALATQALPAVLAFCCGSEGDGHLHYCGDYTAPTPCCATGSCNIFCCACEGVCRGSSKLLLERDPGEVSFSLADSAGNGNLTLDQYLEYMGIDGQPEVWTDWFKKHDKNGDGVITEDEI